MEAGRQNLHRRASHIWLGETTLVSLAEEDFVASGEMDIVTKELRLEEKLGGVTPLCPVELISLSMHWPESPQSKQTLTSCHPMDTFSSHHTVLCPLSLMLSSGRFSYLEHFSLLHSILLTTIWGWENYTESIFLQDPPKIQPRVLLTNSAYQFTNSLSVLWLHVSLLMMLAEQPCSVLPSSDYSGHCRTWF